MTGRTRQAEQDRQKGPAQQDRQNRTSRTGQAEQDRQEKKGRTAKEEHDRQSRTGGKYVQNWRGITGLAVQKRKNGDMQNRTGRSE